MIMEPPAGACTATMGSTSERKPFLLRLDPTTMAALRAWAADDLRSLNGQIEYLLRGALRDAGRLPRKTPRDGADAGAQADGDVPPEPRRQQPSRVPAVREPVASGKVTR
jgi:hypothetical protein